MTPFTTITPGYSLALTALVDGRTTASVWNFGEGLVVSNRLYASHAWTIPGDYPLILSAYNEDNPGGISATVTVHVVTQPVHYVAANNANPVAPYASWETAAANIQDAVDAATVPGALVLVTNGIYASSGRALVGVMTNRVAVDKSLDLRSINGPEFTVIQGHKVPGTTNGNGAVRCVYLADNARLSGFTLTNGATVSGQGGGGVWCQSTNAMLTNCILVGNASSESGGGSVGGTLNDCALNANRTLGLGGGAYGGVLNGCSLASNAATGYLAPVVVARRLAP